MAPRTPRVYFRWAIASRIIVCVMVLLVIAAQFLAGDVEVWLIVGLLVLLLLSASNLFRRLQMYRRLTPEHLDRPISANQRTTFQFRWKDDDSNR